MSSAGLVIRSALLACFALASPASQARAETARSVSADTDLTQPEITDAPSQKSPGSALAYAIGTTVVGWGMAAGGIAASSLSLFVVGEFVSAFGPSAGHFYAGEVGHGFATSLVRGGALFAADAIIVLAFEDEWDTNKGEGLFLGCLGVAAGLGLYDWIDAPRAARRANERNGFDLGFVPMAPDRNGRPTLGLALVRNF